jgi:hypothetical protein
MGFEAILPSAARSAQSKFLYEKPRKSACERALVVDDALQPTWRGFPRADCGENGLVRCAGELSTFCRPAVRALRAARPLPNPEARRHPLPHQTLRRARSTQQLTSPWTFTLSLKPGFGPVGTKRKKGFVFGPFLLRLLGRKPFARLFAPMSGAQW